MRLIKRSARSSPKLSLVLVDWSVRESFHLLHYLARQDVPRELFEVIVVEYYDRRSDAVAAHEEQVDAWLLLEMPASTYYHKHLMYNAGLLLAKGDIVVVGDSDAMVRESFIRSILERFAAEPGIVLHLDQYRNDRKDLYPFRYPSFEDVTGPGCINDGGGRTMGLADRRDPLHSRNYGACMCARRDDLIAIGGADQHIDYLGHICGPYEMTFRLLNMGRREVWHASEFMYHSWHPGAYGADNYLGPHDGRHMSSTALEALASGRVLPLVENAAIRALRCREPLDEAALGSRLIAPEDARDWQRDAIRRASREERFRLLRYARMPCRYRGFRLERAAAGFTALPLLDGAAAAGPRGEASGSGSLADLLDKLDRRAAPADRLAAALGGPLFVAHRLVGRLVRRGSRGGRSGGGRAAPRAPFLARWLRRLRFLARETRTYVAELAGLGEALALLPRGRSTGELLVVVGGRVDARYLQLLARLALLPRLDIRHAADLDELESLLAALAERGWGGKLVAPRALYARFHAAFAQRRPALEIVVA